MYRPQICRPEPENECFYDQLQYAFAKVPATEILIPVGDWNSHIGAPAGVFSDAHGGHSFGTRNTEGERILEFAIANGLRIGSTSSKKRDHTWSHTIWWPLILNRIDYIFYCKSFSSAVSNMKVIHNEECVKQQHVVVCDFSARIPCVKKRKFAPHIQTWKLRDPATASQFQFDVE